MVITICASSSGELVSAKCAPRLGEAANGPDGDKSLGVQEPVMKNLFKNAVKM